MESSQSSPPVKTTQNSLRILELLDERGSLPLAAVVSELPYAKSTVHRHLETLVDEGYVIRDDDRYRLSLRFLDIGVRVRERRPLFSAARDRADELAEETGEQVWCVVEESGMAVPIYGRAFRKPVQTNVSIGQHIPLNQLAAGKAIMAYLPEGRIEQIIDRHGLPDATRHTVTTRETLLEDLEQVRETGVSFNREESNYRLHAIAAPVKNPDDVAIGAISVSGPSGRLRGETFTEQLPDRLLEITNEIEVDLLYD